MLFPDVENTAPRVRSAAPLAPRNVAAASASGVFDCARFGNVPSDTTCASVMTIVTIAMVMISAKGTMRRAARVSPAVTGTTSYPPNAKMRSSTDVDSEPKVRSVCGRSRPGSTANMPAMMNTTNGSSFPTVNAFTTRLL